MPTSKQKSNSKVKILFSFLPFWVFLAIFKFGAGLHYSLTSPLGERLLPLWAVGLLMGGAAFVQLILDVPAGYLLDRFGYLRLLKIGALIFMLAGVALATGLSITTYLLSLGLSILGWLFFQPGINAYILSQAPKKDAGLFISFRDVFTSIGVVLSSSVLSFVLMYALPQAGFYISILMVLALGLLLFSKSEKRSVHEQKKIATQDHYIQRHFLGTVVKAFNKLNPASSILLLLQLAASAFYGIIWFVVPLVIEHQANSGILGFGLGIFDLAIVTLGFLLGRLADKSNKRMLVFVGLLLFSIAGLLLGFDFGWLFLFFGFLATSGDEMASISLWAWLHSLDKNHANDGTIAGVLSLGEDLGWTVGPIAAGFIYGAVGATWTIVIGSLPIFFTWVIYQYLSRRHSGKGLAGIKIPAKPHRFRHKT